MLGGLAVKAQPNDQPNETEGASNEKRVRPAEAHRDERNEQRGKDGAQVGAGVEYSGGQRALLARKPLCDGLEGGGKVSGFAKSKKEACDSKTQWSTGQRMRCRGNAPEGHHDGITDACADPVNHSSCDQQSHGVRNLECGDDVAVLGLSPADGVLQRRGQNAEHLAVHVVDRRGVKQQGADGPTQAPARSVRIHRVASQLSFSILRVLLLPAASSLKDVSQSKWNLL